MIQFHVLNLRTLSNTNNGLFLADQVYIECKVQNDAQKQGKSSKSNISTKIEHSTIDNMIVERLPKFKERLSTLRNIISSQRQ